LTRSAREPGAKVKLLSVKFGAGVEIITRTEARLAARWDRDTLTRSAREPGAKVKLLSVKFGAGVEIITRTEAGLAARWNRDALTGHTDITETNIYDFNVIFRTIIPVITGSGGCDFAGGGNVKLNATNTRKADFLTVAAVAIIYAYNRVNMYAVSGNIIADFPAVAEVCILRTYYRSACAIAIGANITCCAEVPVIARVSII